MSATQIYQHINNVASQMLGNTAVTITDTAGVVALGRQVMESETSLSAFYSALGTVIAKTYAVYKRLKDRRLGIRKDPISYGAIVRSLSVKSIAQAVSNPSWDPTNPQTQTIVQDTTDLTAEYFEQRGTFEITPKVIYDYQTQEAFESAEAFMALSELVFSDMYNAMELAIRGCENDTICTAIACAASAELTKSTCINLLAGYNTAHPTATLTADNALTSPEFLRYAGAEIRQTIKYLPDPSAQYNVKGYETWTEPEDMHVQLLSQFVSNTATYLQSDTFNKELVQLPGFDERTYWQGTENRAKVSIKNADVEATVYGVIGFIFDDYTANVMIDKIRTKSDYKSRWEHTEYYHKADWASFVRQSTNGVVFYVDDYVPIPHEEPADWSTAYASYYVRDLLDEYQANTSSTFDDSKQYYKKIS